MGEGGGFGHCTTFSSSSGCVSRGEEERGDTQLCSVGLVIFRTNKTHVSCEV